MGVLLRGRWYIRTPSRRPFKLGDADTTSKVLVEHLICACTGLPRQDFEWLLEFAKATRTLVFRDAQHEYTFAEK
jgi:hypothetical protein